MKCVILAGGLGTRMAEETDVRPKPMVEVGGRPILWHIMKIYSAAGIHDFIICLGYKGYVIKEYFSNYFLHNSDVTFDMTTNQVVYHTGRAEPWRVTLIDTGHQSGTGGRLTYLPPYLGDDDTFLLTYGDGVADVDVAGSIRFHQAHGRKVTMTVVAPPGRFGATEVDGDTVRSFREKPAGDSLINGGFMVLNRDVIGYVRSTDEPLEGHPLARLAQEGEVQAWRHGGFWHPMDTTRDRRVLEDLWASGRAPWKLWT